MTLNEMIDRLFSSDAFQQWAEAPFSSYSPEELSVFKEHMADEIEQKGPAYDAPRARGKVLPPPESGDKGEFRDLLGPESFAGLGQYLQEDI